MSAASAPAQPRHASVFQGTCFALLACAAPATAVAFALRAPNHILQIIVSVIVGDFLVGFDFAQGPDEDPSAIGICLGVRIARVIGVARDVPPGGTIDRDSRVDFVEIAVAAALEPKSFLGTYAGTFVFGDFFMFFDRPDGKQTKAGDGSANSERSSGHYSSGQQKEG